MVIKGTNTLKKKPAPSAPPESAKEERLLLDMRDVLKANV